MQPRGQVWFELAKVCRDFREYSGLEPAEALKILVIVLGNMQAEQQEALARLNAPQPS